MKAKTLDRKTRKRKKPVGATDSDAMIQRISTAFPPGVNLCGYMRTESGVGTAVRRYLRALQRVEGLAVSVMDLSHLCANRAEDRTIGEFDAEHPHPINLVCVDVEKHFGALEAAGSSFFENHYNIGIWAWELPRFPEKWYNRFAYYDEIWVGSAFIANSLAPIAPVPVVRIPPVLTLDAPASRESGRRRLGVGDDELLYLFVFNANSTYARKNPLAVIEAFNRAFLPSERARLVIKCVNGSANSRDFAAITALALDGRVDIQNECWTPEEMRDVMAACDVYVSLHRSEGTGLTISDAMALGKPVIATGWSGNMDFMNVGNSFPVRFEMVTLTENAGPYRAGETWAEPSVEHAAELMRLTFENREETGRRGEAARRGIEAGFSAERIAELIQERLKGIAVRRRFSAFTKEAKEGYASYQRAAGLVREAIMRDIPRGTHVLVVSKGDDEMVKLDGWRAGHFPQEKGGVFAGFYPADSVAAIEHLEALRRDGAGFLVLPATAFWWLQHYRDFARHLDSHYERVCCDQSCMIYRLFPQGVPSARDPRMPRLEWLARHIHALLEREVEVREKLLDTGERLAWRESQIESLIQTQQVAAGGRAKTEPAGPSLKQVAYRNAISQIRRVVAGAVPKGAIILVASKGDEELLQFEGRTGWHFLQTETGIYAGHHPADGAAAVKQVEELRAKGAGFLLLPSTAFWWLPHYAELRACLDGTATCIHQSADCMIYRLSSARARKKPRIARK